MWCNCYSLQFAVYTDGEINLVFGWGKPFSLFIHHPFELWALERFVIWAREYQVGTSHIWLCLERSCTILCIICFKTRDRDKKKQENRKIGTISDMRIRKRDRQTQCKKEQAAVNKKLHLLEAPGNRQPGKLQSLIGNAFTNRLRVAASLQWSKFF